MNAERNSAFVLVRPSRNKPTHTVPLSLSKTFSTTSRSFLYEWETISSAAIRKAILSRLRYTLSDNNSNTGTFVDNVELAPRERRVIEAGTLFTLGATSILLREPESENEA